MPENALRLVFVEIERDQAVALRRQIMSTHRMLALFLISLSSILISLLIAGGALAQGSIPPAPLPHDCGGVSPLDGPSPACCAFGYIYANGAPATNASVTIRSAHGATTTQTSSGTASSFPYYRADLRSAPLGVAVGDIITVSASYGGHTTERIHTVAAAGQQVDVVVLTPGIDLTIQSIAVEPPNPAPGQPVTITVTILNQGDTTAPGFSTFLYVDPTDEPPTVATPDTSLTFIFGLEPGQSYQWRITGVTFAQECYSLWAWADRDEEAAESDETNNMAHLENCSACQGDTFEEDDTCDLAQSIATDGIAQQRNHCPVGDLDWATFEATAGVTYTIAADAVGGDANVVLALHDSCAGPGFGTGSQIVWNAPSDGVYYIESYHHEADPGPDTRYALSVSAETVDSCAGDTFEPDDNCAAASTIGVDGVRQPHRFCKEADEDWVRFDAAGGTDYLIVADNTGADASPILYLYNACGSAAPMGYGQEIQWRAPADGAYFLKSRNHDHQVHGANATYDLRVEATQAATIKTLILVNRAQVEAIYGATEAANMMGSLQALASYGPAPGLVVQVEIDAAVAAAYTQWNADPLSTAKANAAAAAVRTVVFAQLAANPGVENIVIAGDDRVIPFRRTLDRTYYPENNYASSVSPGTTLRGAAQDSMSLTDDYYADKEPTPWSGHELYLPDFAIGRLIERPAEISAQIDAFLTGDEAVADKVLVTGYDFVQDAAWEICTAWQTDIGADNVDCSLIGESWPGSQLTEKQLNTTPRFTVQSINGHANHRVEGTPDGNNVSADAIATTGASDLSRGLIYTLGCHSGFPDQGNDAIGGNGLDLAQAFARRKANYVANTGFGWGTDPGIALSERLMKTFTAELARGSDVKMGQALLQAKQRYYLESPWFDDYDEKILIEATFYGLPMYVLRTGGVLAEEDPFPSVVVTPTAQLAEGSLTTRRLNIGLLQPFSQMTATTTANGSYYSLDAHEYLQVGEPVQPLFYVRIPAANGVRLHGAVLAGGAYSVTAGFDPVIARPHNEYYSQAEPAFSAPGWYPPAPWSVRTGATVSTPHDTLVTIMGQYHSAQQAERTYNSLAFDLFYSASADWLAPTIAAVALTPAGPDLRIGVTASDVSGIQRAAVAYTNGQGVWQSLDLEHNTSSQQWVGSIPAGAEWLVQVVDGAGNVRLSTTSLETTTVYLPLIRGQ